jgi:YaaC-like Protein
MDVERIPTENPQIDQWRLIGQFSYPTNISKFLTENSISKVSPDLEEYVAGCVRQAESYFMAGENATLDISPLLFYYGTTNLLTGVSALLTGEIKTLKHHGLKLEDPTTTNLRIADFLMKPFYPAEGALQYFCDVLSNKCPLTSCGNWILEEIFGSVPDLKKDFENCYENAIPHTVKVDLFKRLISDPKDERKQKEVLYEKIDPKEFVRHERIVQSLNSIENFSSSYLRPQQYGSENSTVTLHRKLRSSEIGFYSIYGEKFLELPHIKNNKNLNPIQLIILFMGLFALGNISRYKPQIWNPFVRADITGERLLVEKFISISKRYVPNLALNIIRKKRVEFYHPTNSVIIKGEER